MPRGADEAVMTKRPKGHGPGTAEYSAEVAVIGGGMVGTTIAAILARAGLETVLVDREEPAKLTGAAYDGRASAIAHASQKLMAAGGLWTHMAAEAQAILEIRVSDGGSPLFLHYDHEDLGGEPLGYMVENRHILSVLHQEAAASPNLRILAPATAQGMEHHDHNVEIALSGGGRVTARVAIAADGRESALRAAADIRTIGWKYPQTGIVCTIEHERPHRGVAHEHFLPAGPFAILPLKGNRSSLVWTERNELAPAMMALDDDAFDSEIRVRMGDFLGAVKSAGPRWSYPLALHHAETYTAHRLALVGDAAHGMHPIAGQGLNMGLRDVAVLAEVLVDARRLGLDIGGPDVLAHYQRWRRFDNMVLLAVTDILNRLFSNDIAAVRTARDLGLAAVNKMPRLKKFFMEHARGTAGTLPRLLRGEAL